MHVEILLLDFIGTFAFASYGSYFAIKRGFDLFGIVVCAFLTAFGGGTICEVLLQRIPFYLRDSRYIFVLILGIIFTLCVYKFFAKINFLMQFLDAIGLVTFAFIGSLKAIGAGMDLFGIIFFASTTAVGGGIIRDTIMNEVPEIMYSNFYASVAAILGFFCWLGKRLDENLVHNIIFINALLATCLALRITAIICRIQLWRPWNRKTN